MRCLERDFAEDDLRSLGREEVDGIVDTVFVTLGKEHPTSESSAQRLSCRGLIRLGSLVSKLCRRMRIPVNVVDAPNLSTFSLLSTHSDGPLQIGITTSGKGCKLAARIRREVAAALPPDLGAAIDRLGAMRRKIWEQDHRSHDLAEADDSDDDALNQKATFNQLVTEETESVAKARRIRWLGQICEYWPLRRLAAITDAEIDTLLASYSASQAMPSSTQLPASDAPGLAPKPSVILAGSGPGSPHLLTLATHRAIQTADLILADKLVPTRSWPSSRGGPPCTSRASSPATPTPRRRSSSRWGSPHCSKGRRCCASSRATRTSTGAAARSTASSGRTGTRPSCCRASRARSRPPLFAAIPCTQRGVADQVLICTGTGRKGAAPRPPPYIKSQTVVFLMALHRLGSLVDSLVGKASSAEGQGSGGDDRSAVARRDAVRGPRARVVSRSAGHPDDVEARGRGGGGRGQPAAGAARAGMELRGAQGHGGKQVAGRGGLQGLW